jgi:hypothetical protein
MEKSLEAANVVNQLGFGRIIRATAWPSALIRPRTEVDPLRPGRGAHRISQDVGVVDVNRRTLDEESPEDAGPGDDRVDCCEGTC